MIRPQAGLPDGTSLYIYAANANMAHAQERLMRLLEKKEPGLQATDVFSEHGYQSEHDAVHLLHTLGNSYEPFRPFFWIDPENEKDPRRFR